MTQHLMIGTIGAALVGIVLWESFETIILPRRVTRRVRLTRLLYLLTWNPWSMIARGIRSSRRKEKLLSFFGPLSLIMLLTVWAITIVVGFALLHLAVGQFGELGGVAGIREALYFSGSTFFTLGLGDVTHANTIGRGITVIEAGTGIGFFAMVISYLPVLYQAFSRREVNISMLDARAGTPPTAGELLRRYREAGEIHNLDSLLKDWEKWSADLLESHLSYPVLCFFRSQHDNQSWLSALSTILDTCSLVMVGIDGVPKWQAQLTFKMTRHAVVDLAQVFNTSPVKVDGSRLTSEELEHMRNVLGETGIALRNEPGDEKILSELREMYEPYIEVLSQYLLMPLPGWLPKPKAIDNWQTSAWEVRTAREEPFKKCMRDAHSKRFRAAANEVRK
jgi:Ion channel